MINTPTQHSDTSKPQSSVGWMIVQTRHGLGRVLVGTGSLLATGVGGVVGAGGTIIGGTLDGTSRGIREALGGGQRSGEQGTMQPT
ncbi:hypothetical protein FJZ27_01410 [Candidatus Peribacteria bacterium]|nr:hypothetical protein [Candidatus Peribacteria bacterium]